MSRLSAVALLLAALAAACFAEEKYSARFDNINLDAILSDDQKLAQYKDCLIQDANDSCTEEGAALKRILAEAIQNNCAKCTEKQKGGAAKAIKFLHTNKPDIWQEISNKYDPTGVFARNHPEIIA